MIILTISELNALIGIVAACFTAIVTIGTFVSKQAKKIKVYQDAVLEHTEELKRHAQTLEKIGTTLEKIDKRQIAFEESIKTLQIESYRYFINDAFNGDKGLQEMDSNTLENLASYCDLYLSLGGNHTTGARCKLVKQEIVRREQIRGGLIDE